MALFVPNKVMLFDFSVKCSWSQSNALCRSFTMPLIGFECPQQQSLFGQFHGFTERLRADFAYFLRCSKLAFSNCDRRDTLDKVKTVQAPEAMKHVL